jgi:hypothetical protein
MRKRGRPLGSEIRQNIIEIVYFMKKAYGYEIYKEYNQIFPKISMRSVYYNLKKGTETGEFKVKKIKTKKGDYSWGKESEIIQYKLGKNAMPKIPNNVKEYFNKKEEKGLH